jgi:excisionase family DNA binding protein
MNEQYNDNWIGIEEVSAYLGVKKDTVRNWIKKNRYTCT